MSGRMTTTSSGRKRSAVDKDGNQRFTIDYFRTELTIDTRTGENVTLNDDNERNISVDAATLGPPLEEPKEVLEKAHSNEERRFELVGMSKALVKPGIRSYALSTVDGNVWLD